MSSIVCFLVRDDFFSKFGGDTFQVENYKKSLINLGVSVLICTLDDFLLKPPCSDIFFVVNIDRGFECVRFYEILKNKNCLDKTYVVPIHHDNAAVKRFNVNRYSYFFSIFSNIFFVEKIKACVRALRSKKNIFESFFHLFFVSYKNKIKSLLLESKGIIAIANGEILKIETDFNISIKQKATVIYNGVTKEFVNSLGAHDDGFYRDIDVLVSGRIEERKNQLKIAKVLLGKPFNIKFVGALNENNKRYCDEFLKVISDSSNLEYLGKVEPDEMISLYKRSRIHLSCSWFEVSSLVDIEAFFAGCYVFSSKNGHSAELLKGDRFSVIDPSDLSGLPTKIEDILKLNIIESSTLYDLHSIRTWDDSGRELYDYIKKEDENRCFSC